MQALIFVGVTASLLLLSCEATNVKVNYKLDAPLTMQLFHSGSYSTEEGKGEKIGTLTATYSEVTFRQEGDAYSVERRLLMDKSKGYHKHSMPQELMYRVPQVQTIAQGMQVHSVRGNEQFVPVVVAKLPIKEGFKRQLRDARYQLEFDRLEKRRWDMGHLIRGEVPMMGNLTSVLKTQGSLPMPGGPAIDSVVSNGYRKMNGKQCYEYIVFYKETEPFPYFVWEQFAYGTETGKVYQAYKADSTHYETQYTIAVDPDNGVPCQERVSKVGTNFIHNPETKEVATFKSFITQENLYTFKDQE